jgi:glycosyltransferase involved in cell wall biosynthesis
VSKISIVIPCYYNEENIPITTAALLGNEGKFPPEVTFEYVFVDDGSEDGTLDELKKFKKQYPEKVTILRLASNVGSYNAIYAGLKHASGECMVVMAADLQDPPELILEMYKQWRQGKNIVLANRIGESNISAKVFRWFLKIVALPNLPNGGFDYCLFDREVNEQFLERMQPNIYSLYSLLTLDYRYVVIPYKKRTREIGTSKWTMKKKFNLAWATFWWFSSERIPMVAYLWRTKRTEVTPPFDIDEVF